MMILIATGLIGMLGMSLLFPSLAYLYRISFRRGCPAKAIDSALPRIAVLIPAHDEEMIIGATINGISAEISRLRKIIDCPVEIVVGADGCTDQTAEEARRCGALVVASDSKVGKWATIRNLVRETAADWVILVDAGAAWPAGFLRKILPILQNPEFVGAAPAYQNPNGGFLERVLWRVERRLKTIESACGGPVSVHGATVCYRRAELLHAMNSLPDSNWLNDDVVLPLVLRGHHPRMRIVYLPGLVVTEQQRPAETKPEFARRKRMVIGNVQWMRRLWIPLWTENQLAALLATRRVFRLFWAYWFVFAGAGSIIYFSSTAAPWAAAAYWLGFAACGAAALRIRAVRKLVPGAAASLLAPYYFTDALFSRHFSEVSQWK